MERFQRNRLEAVLQDANENSKEWLKSEFKAILESNKPYQAKCDYIGYSILSIDDKIALLDEEMEQLKEYKLKLKLAKNMAVEVGAEVLNEYGIAKIEGGGISSITTTQPTVATKYHFVSTNEEEFINQGFYIKVLDEKRIMKCYQDGEYIDFINANAKIISVALTTPSKLRINRRKATAKSVINIDFNSDVAV